MKILTAGRTRENAILIFIGRGHPMTDVLTIILISRRMYFLSGPLARERRVRLRTTDAVTESLGDRIARLRRAKGWNQRELAARIGIQGPQVSKYERGTYLPRPDLLSRLAKALGVSPDYLMTGRIASERRQDFRIRERLDALEALPDAQRDNLVAFLDSLIAAHQLMRHYQELRRRASPKVRGG